MTALEKTAIRFAALLDGSAWMMMAPSLLALFFIDAPMAKTLLQWSLYFVVLVGLVVMISRICFPQIKLHEFTSDALHGSVAGAIVVAAVILFVAIVTLAFVLWAHPSGGGALG